MFGLEVVPEELKAQAQILVLCTAELQRRSAPCARCAIPRRSSTTSLEVNRLESEADQVFRTALGRLFATEKEPIRLMIHKELLEITEEAIDRCQGVANVVEGIVLKNA
jgi:uncharacterized protein Yka (UPF0111/DUF47 family)